MSLKNSKHLDVMNTKFIAAILLCICFLRIDVFSQGVVPMPFFYDKKTADNVSKTEEMSPGFIENKILINLFFRGEVADKIIEENLAGEIMDFSNRSSHAEIREALIIWIEKNPGKAAEMYCGIGDFRAKLEPVKINYAEKNLKIRPAFLKLIKELGASAADSYLADESLSRAGNRLFEGLLAKSEYVDLELPSFAPREKGEQVFNFADFKLNGALLEKEIENLSDRILDVNKIIARNGFGEYGNGMIGDLYIKTFGLHKTFIAEASSLKGRSRITAKESALLEKRRYNLYKNLIALTLFIEGAKVGLARKSFIAARPEFDFLVKGGAGAEKEILKSAREIEKSAMPLGNLSVKAKRAYVLGEKYILKNNFYAWFIEFKTRGDNIGFSCAYDFLLYSHLKFFNPFSNYVKLRHNLKSDLKNLDKILFKIKKGADDRLFGSIFENKKESPDSGIIGVLSRMDKNLVSLEDFSAVNKKIQRVFWDMFFNPFKIDIDKTGKMKIKVNYIGANYL